MWSQGETGQAKMKVKVTVKVVRSCVGEEGRKQVGFLRCLKITAGACKDGGRRVRSGRGDGFGGRKKVRLKVWIERFGVLVDESNHFAVFQRKPTLIDDLYFNTW